MPLKVADSAGSMYFSAIQNALYYAADNGADIISMSLGAAISSRHRHRHRDPVRLQRRLHHPGGHRQREQDRHQLPGHQHLRDRRRRGLAVRDRKRSSSSTSAVNTGVSTDPRGYTCDGERWWGSSYGVTTKDAAGDVDVLGPTILPTTDIIGSADTLRRLLEVVQRDSCATPYVAGVSALIKSANLTSPRRRSARLRTSAGDVVNVESGAGWDRYSGFGMVDAEAAVGGTGPVVPVASFTGTPVSGNAPLNVVFTDASTGSPTSWSWTFGDGGTSTAQNPSRTYTAGAAPTRCP